jgi:acetyl esterase/lipase
VCAHAAVEYRLLQHAPTPGAIQDAAAVYAHLVRRLGRDDAGDDRATRTGAHAGTKIVMIGDSAGGNLVLGVVRWIRDEGVLPLPDGMLLLSPSCDPCMCLLSAAVPARLLTRPLLSSW